MKVVAIKNMESDTVKVLKDVLESIKKEAYRQEMFDLEQEQIVDWQDVERIINTKIMELEEQKQTEEPNLDKWADHVWEEVDND